VILNALPPKARHKIYLKYIKFYAYNGKIVYYKTALPIKTFFTGLLSPYFIRPSADTGSVSPASYF
jgi:hypothetical protein